VRISLITGHRCVESRPRQRRGLRRRGRNLRAPCHRRATRSAVGLWSGKAAAFSEVVHNALYIVGAAFGVKATKRKDSQRDFRIFDRQISAGLKLSVPRSTRVLPPNPSVPEPAHG